MKTPPEPDLTAIEAEARRLTSAAASLSDSVRQGLRGLQEELRSARAEAESLRAALEKEKASRGKGGAAAPPRGRSEAPSAEAEAAGALLAAPFRVSAKAASAARTDPLAALAVQAAKALSPEANPVERARLIAMAFAASQGDLDAFWAARRQRKAATRSIVKTPLRSK